MSQRQKRPARYVVIGIKQRTILETEQAAVEHASNIVRGNYRSGNGITELVVVKVLKTVKIEDLPVKVIPESRR